MPPLIFIVHEPKEQPGPGDYKLVPPAPAGFASAPPPPRSDFPPYSCAPYFLPSPEGLRFRPVILFGPGWGEAKTALIRVQSLNHFLWFLCVFMFSFQRAKNLHWI